MNKLKHGAYFTDIHWGRKQNSVEHNSDCLNFVKWMINEIEQSDKKIDHVVFLGDWFELRSAIDTFTGNIAFEGAELLNALNIPVYFIVGNHDMYVKHNRKYYSTKSYKMLSNFVVIDEVTVRDEFLKKTLFAPYILEGEESIVKEAGADCPIWHGHFEFKGFLITGYNIRMRGGPNPAEFTKPLRIFSGHFHKRQTEKNITYIGNTFPADFGDCGDTNKGFCKYDYETNDMSFVDWPECPQYVRIKLSKLINDDTLILPNDSRVDCTVDIKISFEENIYMMQHYSDKFNLREFTMTEDPSLLEEVLDEENTEESIDGNKTVKESVVSLICDNIDDPKINNETLIDIYTGLGDEA